MTPGGSNTVHIYTHKLIYTHTHTHTLTHTHTHTHTVHRTTHLTTLVGRLSGIRTQRGQTKINDELRKNCGLMGRVRGAPRLRELYIFLNIYLLLLFSTRVLPSRYTTGYLQSFTMNFYNDVCGVHEEYRQIYFPWAPSWSAWKMRLRKFVMLTVFM